MDELEFHTKFTELDDDILSRAYKHHDYYTVKDEVIRELQATIAEFYRPPQFPALDEQIPALGGSAPTQVSEPAAHTGQPGPVSSAVLELSPQGPRVSHATSALEPAQAVAPFPPRPSLPVGELESEWDTSVEGSIISDIDSSEDDIGGPPAESRSRPITMASAPTAERLPVSALATAVSAPGPTSTLVESIVRTEPSVGSDFDISDTSGASSDRWG